MSEGEDEVCERAEAGVVHLSPVQSQAVGEGHGVLIRGIARTDAQDLRGTRKKRFTIEKTEYFTY